MPRLVIRVERQKQPASICRDHQWPQNVLALGLREASAERGQRQLEQDGRCAWPWLVASAVRFRLVPLAGWRARPWLPGSHGHCVQGTWAIQALPLPCPPHPPQLCSQAKGSPREENGERLRLHLLLAQEGGRAASTEGALVLITGVGVRKATEDLILLPTHPKQIANFSSMEKRIHYKI